MSVVMFGVDILLFGIFVYISRKVEFMNLLKLLGALALLSLAMIFGGVASGLGDLNEMIFLDVADRTAGYLRLNYVIMLAIACSLIFKSIFALKNRMDDGR